MAKELGELLEKSRIHKGLSGKGAARTLGITPLTYSMWRDGVWEPGVDPFEGFKSWMTNRQLLRASTVRGYSTICRCAENWMVAHLNKPLAGATFKDIQAFMDTRPTSSSSRNNGRSALICYGQYLIDIGARKKNPAKRLVRVKQVRGLPKPFAAELVRPFLEEATKDSLVTECAITLFIYTGKRASEIRLLQWADWCGDYFQLEQKGGQVCIIPLNSRCQDVLTRWAKLCPSETYVFPSPRGGKFKGLPASQQWMWRKVKDVGKRAGIKACRPHRIRYTHAKKILDDTGNIMLVKDALGHSNLDNTLIYVEMSKAKLATAQEEMDWG